MSRASYCCRVGVDDHVGAELECRVDAGRERLRQPLGSGKANDVVGRRRGGPLSAVPSDGPVVDDE
jgi:hypothetical protein